MTGPGGGFIFVNGKGEHLVVHPHEQQHLLAIQEGGSAQQVMEKRNEPEMDPKKPIPPSDTAFKGKEPAYSPPTAFESTESSETAATRSGTL